MNPKTPTKEDENIKWLIEKPLGRRLKEEEITIFNIGKRVGKLQAKQQTLKDVLKIIDDKKKHYKSSLVKSVRIALDELKAQIEKELGVEEKK